jgi:hypothetical protein
MRAVDKFAVVGWLMMIAGTALWLYGYLASGHPPLIDWNSSTPWWIADYLPNSEAEAGMALVFASMIPIYWPRRHR